MKNFCYNQPLDTSKWKPLKKQPQILPTTEPDQESSSRSRLMDIQQKRVKDLLKKETEELLTVSDDQVRASRRETRKVEESGKNRRRTRRVWVNEVAQWEVDKIRRDGLVRDISRWGLMLQCSIPIPRYSNIKVFLPLTVGANRVLCFLPGVVMWSSNKVIGVEFVDIPPESLTQLTTFLKARRR